MGRGLHELVTNRAGHRTTVLFNWNQKGLSL